MKLDSIEFSNAVSFLEHALQAFNINNVNFLQAFAEIMGMNAENQVNPGTYSKGGFENVLQNHGCHVDSVTNSFQF